MGFSTKEISERVYDNLDFLRGVETFLNFVPAASIEALRQDFIDLWVTSSSHLIVMDQLLDSNALFLTGNEDTVYLMTTLDLEKDGPTVIEIPPGCGPGTVDDAFSALRPTWAARDRTAGKAASI
jgi:hypothetical protein